jgi:flagellar protein FliJ
MAFKLAAVLRARHAKEDAAKAAAAQARLEADAAAVRVRAAHRDLDGRRVPDATSAAAFTAAMSARTALASVLSTAVGELRTTEGAVDDRLQEAVDAAVQRRTMEKLEERHATARRHVEDRADEKAVDDLTTAAYQRRSEARSRPAPPHHRGEQPE